MLGVVLWSDISDRKAVIWCEDQGDLAFVSGKDHGPEAGDFFDAGDLVQFDMKMRDKTRFAMNPRLIVEQGGASLPRTLKSAGIRRLDQGTDRGEVVPFARPVKETYTVRQHKERQTC